MQYSTTVKYLWLSAIIVSTCLLVLGVYFYATGKRWIFPDSVYIFEGVEGPAEVTSIAPASVTPWQKYANGTTSRLAILLTDENSSWLGLVHGLKSIGVPLIVTRDIDQAMQHNVMLVYPNISGRLLEQESLRKLATYARTGGVLIGINVLGGGLNRIFGFDEVIASRKHTRVELSDMQVIGKLNTLPGKTIRLASAAISESVLGSYSYSSPKHAPLGRYEDGSAAIIYNAFERGNVYAIGFDVGFYILKGYNRRLEGVASTYANDFEPSIDVILSLLKNIYKAGNPEAVTLGTVPFNKSLSVMLTHDIDYSYSLVNAVQYAQLEQKENTSGTHFIQTKYIRDWNDEIFFDKENLEYLRNLQSTGIEIGSHSVSHSLEFARFPLGGGDEQYPSYRPFVKNEEASYNGTILGELRVSKFLLEHFLPDTTIDSFRPGYLANPTVLPQLLQSTGYKYSSSVSANVSMTHLPFRLNYDRDIDSEVDVFEFPITVEDELPPRMGDRLPRAIELAEKISRYGGIYVVLIHPDVLDHKFRFEQGLIAAVRDYSWFGSIAGFGDWWSARDQIELDVSTSADKYQVSLAIPEPIRGLTLELPDNLEYSGSNSDYPLVQFENRLVIEKADKDLTLYLRKTGDNSVDR